MPPRKCPRGPTKYTGILSWIPGGTKRGAIIAPRSCLYAPKIMIDNLIGNSIQDDPTPVATPFDLSNHVGGSKFSTKGRGIQAGKVPVSARL